MSKLNQLLSELCPNGIPFYKLNEIFDIKNGYTPSKANAAYWENGNLPWFRMEDIREHGHILSESIQHISLKAVKGSLFPANSIIVATSATIGEHALITVDFLSNQRFTCLSIKQEFVNHIDPMYVFHWCYELDKWCLNNSNTSSFASVDMTKFVKFKIPVPPLPIQREIVRILDNFTERTEELKEKLTAELTARKKQYEYYRDYLLSFDFNISIKTINELCYVYAGGDAPKDTISKQKSDIYSIPVISNGIGDNALYGYTTSAKITVPAVTVAARGTIGYAEYRDYHYFPIIRLLSVIPKKHDELNTKFLYYCLQGKKYKVPTSGIPQLIAPELKKVGAL